MSQHIAVPEIVCRDGQRIHTGTEHLAIFVCCWAGKWAHGVSLVWCKTGFTWGAAESRAVFPTRQDALRAAIASVLNDLNYIANRNERGLPRGVFSNFFRLADEIGTGQLNLFEP